MKDASPLLSPGYYPCLRALSFSKNFHSRRTEPEVLVLPAQHGVCLGVESIAIFVGRDGLFVPLVPSSRVLNAAGGVQGEHQDGRGEGHPACGSRGFVRAHTRELLEADGSTGRSTAA